ncbi:MAG: decaprenyl-phosphate phosphoribosyltransferase [Candidatus Omnitrophota bacterium]
MNKYILESMRPRHWVKNLFILAPLIFGQKLFDWPSIYKVIAAFFLFCLAASSAYIINDIFDCEKDRHHPKKARRPIASNKISLSAAKLAALILLGVSLSGAFYLNHKFAIVILAYFILNIFYSVWLKYVVIIDVMCIGVFFILRLVAGSIVINQNLSHWIIICGGLLALFLGFSKRYAETYLLDKKAADYRPVLDSYDLKFLSQMVLIIASALVICYTLYTIDARTYANFGTKNLLYTIPLVYYGIFRYLYDLLKNKVQLDPTSIFFNDKKLQLNVLLWIIAVIIIIY